MECWLLTFAINCWHFTIHISGISLRNCKYKLWEEVYQFQIVHYERLVNWYLETLNYNSQNVKINVLGYRGLQITCTLTFLSFGILPNKYLIFHLLSHHVQALESPDAVFKYLFQLAEQRGQCVTCKPWQDGSSLKSHLVKLPYSITLHSWYVSAFLFTVQTLKM